MTLIEALASGIPVIANNVGAISRLVDHKINGYLTSDLKSITWTKALNDCLVEYEKWKLNAKQNANLIESKFSAKTWGEKTLALYKELMARSAT